MPSSSLNSPWQGLTRVLGHPRLDSVMSGLTEWCIERLAGPQRTFFDPAGFPWIEPIEADWRLIRRELDHIMQDPASIPAIEDISSAQASLTTDKRWKAYFLCAYGEWAEGHCERCPETARLLRRVPGLQTAFFSLLEPGKHLPRHHGKYKGVLRYHLGLRIPEPVAACALKVGDELRHWHEGKSLVFDDRKPHEAWNNTDRPRVVLIVDFLRPMALPLSLLNRMTTAIQSQSPFAQEIYRAKGWK